MAHQTLLVLDFGSQYTQLIARRLRELKVYTEVLPFHTPLSDLAARDEGSPRCEAGVFDLGIPVLGICYGMQLMADMLGGSVEPAPEREFGHASVTVEIDSPLFQ